MSWNYEENPKLQIVEVEYKDHITGDDLHESNSEFIRLQKEKSLIKFLIDATQAELIASLADLYSLPTTLYTEESADRLGQVALLLPTSPKAKEAARFYETVCKNRGWRVQTFSERQKAVNWLIGK